MWLNERRRGPGGSASSAPAGGQRRFLLVLLPERRGRGARRAGDSRPEDASLDVSSGPRPAAPGSSGLGDSLGGSGSQVPLPRRRGAHQLPREPRPGSRPLGPYYSRARAGAAGRGTEACSAPAGPPRRGATLVAPGLREGGFQGRLRRRRRSAAAPRRRPRPGQGRSVFPRSMHAGLFPPPLFIFIFSSCHWHLVALVMMDRTEVKPLIKKTSESAVGVFPLPGADGVEDFSPLTFHPTSPRIGVIRQLRGRSQALET